MYEEGDDFGEFHGTNERFDIEEERRGEIMLDEMRDSQNAGKFECDHCGEHVFEDDIRQERVHAPEENLVDVILERVRVVVVPEHSPPRLERVEIESVAGARRIVESVTVAALTRREEQKMLTRGRDPLGGRHGVMIGDDSKAGRAARLGDRFRQVLHGEQGLVGRGQPSTGRAETPPSSRQIVGPGMEAVRPSVFF